MVSEHDRCEALWNITGGQICAAGQTDSALRSDSSRKQTVADSCNGDSGGGLTSTNSRGKQARRPQLGCDEFDSYFPYKTFQHHRLFLALSLLESRIAEELEESQGFIQMCWIILIGYRR